MNTLSPIAVWIHDLDPFIFEIDGYGPRWYGLSYIAGLVFGWWIIRRWCQRQRLPLQPDKVQDLVMAFGFGMIIGGRIGYCLFYDTSLLGFSSNFPFWKLLAVWGGGMASHGGIVGMFLGTLYFCRKQKVPFLVICDAAATVTPIGIITGRTANFINGELWGRPLAEGSSAWGIKFPSSLQADLIIQHKPMGLMNTFYNLQPGSPEYIAFVNQHVLTRHPSQIYAALMEGLVVLIIAMFFHNRHHRPGLSVGIVTTCYGIMRFFSEFFRQPDQGYQLFFGWMSKGQALSFPVLIVGLTFIWIALKKPARPELYSLPT